MKSTRTVLAALLLATAALFAAPRAAHASVAVSISVFHDDLAPYGRWVSVGSYGSCFVPRVGAGWAPYVDGQWVYTDYGWTWVSNDPFGDVPFHYGSWTWANSYGWVWVPGTVWAPAWVTWAYGDDYVGWAPVPPSFGLTATGYVGAPVVLPATRYVFVPTRQFVGVPVASIRLPAARNDVIFARTVKTTEYRVSGGVVRTAGPSTARIERVAGTKVAPVSIDRVRARPTTIAEAGAGTTGRIRVAAPASETRKLATSAPESRSAAAKNAPKNESHGKAHATEPPAAAARGRETAPSAGREAAPPPAHAAKREAPKESPKNERPADTHAAAPSREKPPATTQKHEKKPEKAPAHEAAPNPSAARSHPAEPPKPEAPRQPTEETRVAAHGQPHPASPANHPPRPAPNKAKPAEKKPPEKAPEQKPE